jgi:3,4-dihydroxyphenylacetate 2,3-dioxygenase
VSTFEHLVDATPRHEGVLTASECPQLIANVPYRYPGDKELAETLAQAGCDAGLPVIAFDEPSYVWDYGTVVPLRYLDPEENIPTISLSVCWSADLEESYRWGQIIGRALKESNKRAAFVASGALSHNVVRGPERWPTPVEMSLDHMFIDYLREQKLAEAQAMLPQFAQIAKVESGGRHVAATLGVLSEYGSYQADVLAYAQSSGSGNPIIVFQRTA